MELSCCRRRASCLRLALAGRRHCLCGGQFTQMRATYEDQLTSGAVMLSTKGIVSSISISRPPSLPLWRSIHTDAHPGVLVGQVGFLDSGNVDIVVVEESQLFSDFAADSFRVSLCQS